jgi:hypothetical protein
LELSTVTRTEPSLRTARFSMKYRSGKYATGVKVTARAGAIGMASWRGSSNEVGRPVISAATFPAGRWPSSMPILSCS